MSDRQQMKKPFSKRAAPARRRVSHQGAARQHRQEFRRLKGELDVAAERYQAQTEALRVSNEELHAMNEELRASTRALEASREELESRVQQRTRDLALAVASLDQEVRDRRQAENRIRGLLRRVITVQEDERRRIARDLHDHLGQHIAALRLKLETIRIAADKGESLVRQLDQAEEVIVRLDRDLDFFTWELRPPPLDDLGVGVALGNLVRDWSKNFGVPADFHSRGLTHVRLPRDVETALYRIAQEALNNIYKHANATRVAVILERQGPDVLLVVEDNGHGFDRTSEVRDERDRGLGLIGMNERAALIGGTLEIETTPDRGTTIFVRVPHPGVE